jgi:hypothetical protein
MKNNLQKPMMEKNQKKTKRNGVLWVIALGLCALNTQAQTNGQVLTRVAGGSSWQTPQTYTAGTGIGITNGVITNTSVDRTVVLTGAGATTVTGTYPNFTITSTDNNTTYTAGTGISIVGTQIRATNNGDITGVTAGDGLVGTNENAGAVTLHVVAENGLTDNANNVVLGGALNQATTITFGANSMTFNLDNFGDFFIHDNSDEVFAVESSGNVTINEVGADNDFRVESDGNANMLMVDGFNNRVGIGTGTPAERLHLDGGRISITATAGSVYIGDGAGANANLTTAFDNVLIGTNAGTSITTGQQNIALGTNALDAATTASQNIAIGQSTLTRVTTGTGNTFLGNTSGQFITSGNDNVGLGRGVGAAMTTASGNIGFGSNAFPTLQTGADNIAIGFNADVINGGVESVAIGFGSYANASRKIRFGNASITVIEGTVNYTTSDARFKSDFRENVPGLALITRLRPVTYKFEAQKLQEFWREGSSEGMDFTQVEGLRQTGFIAQEVEEVLDAIGYEYNGLHRPEHEKDNYSIAYGQLTVPLVKAVQELHQKNQALEAELAEIRNRLVEVGIL